MSVEIHSPRDPRKSMEQRKLVYGGGESGWRTLKLGAYKLMGLTDCTQKDCGVWVMSLQDNS